MQTGAAGMGEINSKGTQSRSSGITRNISSGSIVNRSEFATICTITSMEADWTATLGGGMPSLWNASSTSVVTVLSSREGRTQLAPASSVRLLAPNNG